MSHVLTLPFGAGTTCRRTSRRPPAAILRAVIVLLVCLSCPTQAATLRVGIEPDTSPLSLYDAQGHPSGLAVEIIQGIATDQRLEVEFVAQSWSELQAEFRAGRIDILAACGMNREREAYMRFSVPHIDLGTGVFVNTSRPPPKNIDEIGRRSIGTTKESLASTCAKEHGWEHLRTYANLPEALNALEKGDCDVVIGSSLVIAHFIRTNSYRRIGLTDLRLPGLAYELHMAVQPDAHALLFKLNLGLAHLHADGTYDRIYEKWIGPLKPRRLRLKEVQPYLVLLAVIAAAVVIAFLWQRRLLRRLANQAAELGQREQQLSLVLEGSNDGFWDWDLRIGSIDRSERWASMLGYTLAELDPVPGQLAKLIHPEDFPIHESARLQLESGATDRFQVEYRIKTKSGEWLWVLDRGKVVVRGHDGCPLRVAGTHTDITERKRTEGALVESQELLNRSAHLLEQTQAVAHIGGWEVDLRTDRVFWTAETHRMHETVPGEFTPTVENAIQFYASESRATIIAAVENAIRHGTPYELELSLVTARGRPIRVHTTGRAEHAEGRVVRIYGSCRDVTVERAADEDREKIRLKMLEAQKLESLGVLAGGIAHDFNNLLTVILANATFARGRAGDPGDERLAHIETAARRAADLCRQMLAYAGRGNFIIERVDVGLLVRDTTQLLQASISKKARLLLTLAPDLPSVEADAPQLRQVVMNLVINASEALGENAGEIRLTTRRSRPDEVPRGTVVHSFDLPSGEGICLEVSDTGQGMSPATLARVFDPFFTTKFAGRGLGLAAVLGIVRAHRGALTVESTVGFGSTFRVHLPAAHRTDLPPKPVSPARPPAVVSGTLLIAEDEPVVLATADALLRHHGYETVLAADGHEAVQQFRANPQRFAAVLLDLTMPGLDGAEVLRVMRALNPEVRILIMSGYSEQHIFARLRGQGEVPVMRKPFTQETLLDRVAEVIAG